MILPLRHDRPLRSIPWVTGALIAINVVLFVASQQQLRELARLRLQDANDLTVLHSLYTDVAPLSAHWLWPSGSGGFHLLQLLSCAFFHSSWIHLLGNMLFLWIFGGAVEDRLGKIGYGVFYVAAAIAASGLYLATGPEGPMLGASGAIAGVSGAFLVLFPQVQVRFFYFFFMIGFFEVSALWVMVAFFAKDAFFFLAGTAGETTGAVAYAAHIGGFLAGFGVAALLLWTKILSREPQWDLMAMWQHKLRRMHHRRILEESTRQQSGAFAESAPVLAFGEAKKTHAPTPELAKARHDLMAKAAMDLEGAARDYAVLLTQYPGHVFHADLQEQLAGGLTRLQHAKAEEAWRLLIASSPRDRRRPQWLMIRAMLLKQAGRSAEARPLAAEAAPGLQGDERKAAEQLAGE